MRPPLYTALDDALDAIAPYGIELKNGNSNHAPMVAEALCALGYPEAVMPWLARYRERMQPRPAAGEPIRRDGWQGALGSRKRLSDWALFFADELEDAPWPTVLDRWVARLAPGFCAAATHGPIRVGHAVRGLAERSTPSRRRELADALAGWAATWQQLPAGDGAAQPRLSPREAIARVPVVPPAQRRSGNIVAALAVLDELPQFASVIDLIDTTGAVAPQIAELTELFTRVYLANARDIATTIAFIHAVTSHAALGNIVPFIGETTAREALRHAWQTGAALYACYGSGTPMANDIEPYDGTTEALVELAIEHGDEHVIKFTEACLKFHRSCLGRHALDGAAASLNAAHHVSGIVKRR
jgi:hypothetical protein